MDKDFKMAIDECQVHFNFEGLITRRNYTKLQYCTKKHAILISFPVCGVGALRKYALKTRPRRWQLVSVACTNGNIPKTNCSYLKHVGFLEQVRTEINYSKQYLYIRICWSNKLQQYYIWSHSKLTRDRIGSRTFLAEMVDSYVLQFLNL